MLSTIKRYEYCFSEHLFIFHKNMFVFQSGGKNLLRDLFGQKEKSLPQTTDLSHIFSMDLTYKTKIHTSYCYILMNTILS